MASRAISGVWEFSSKIRIRAPSQSAVLRWYVSLGRRPVGHPATKSRDDVNVSQAHSNPSNIPQLTSSSLCHQPQRMPAGILSSKDTQCTQSPQSSSGVHPQPAGNNTIPPYVSTHLISNPIRNVEPTNLGGIIAAIEKQETDWEDIRRKRRKAGFVKCGKTRLDYFECDELPRQRNLPPITYFCIVSVLIASSPFLFVKFVAFVADLDAPEKQLDSSSSWA